MRLSDPAQPHVVLKDLSKVFDGRVVLRRVSAVFQRGEIAVIIGGSGAGKTTLLRLLIGLERPTSGQILLSGTDMTQLGAADLNRFRRRLGMVFQYAALLDSMTVLDNVAFPLREHTKKTEEEIRSEVRAMLKEVDLEGIEDRFPSQLSGGMRKRVGLARALMLSPELIVYDEPTSGLDPFTTELVDQLIVKTRDRFGVTSIIISHDMASALRIADTIHVLASGELVASGTPQELVAGKHELATRFIEASGVDTRRVRRAARP